ncbi:MAG: tetratricopeptide repeat protein [Caldilineaceae bacterium]
MEISVASDPDGHFCAHAQRSLGYLLDQLKAAQSAIPPLRLRKLAMHLLSVALHYDELWPFACQILVVVAPKMEQAGHRDEWILLLTACLKQAQVLQDEATSAELHLQLGRLYQLQGAFEAAQNNYAASTRLFCNENNHRQQAYALSREAYIAHLQHHHGRVSRLLDEALALLDNDDIERAGIYAVQGGVVLEQQDWPAAIAYFEQALRLWRQTDNLRMIAWSLRDLGPPLRALERYSEAISCYEEALTIFEQIDDPVHKASTQMNLGVVYLMVHELERALQLFALAEPVFRQTFDQMRLAKVYVNQGITYGQLKQWAQAISQLEAGIHLHRKIGNVRALVNALDELGVIYLAQEQYPEAAATLREALNCLQTISNQPGYAPLYKSVFAHFQQCWDRQASKVGCEGLLAQTPTT